MKQIQTNSNELVSKRMNEFMFNQNVEKMNAKNVKYVMVWLMATLLVSACSDDDNDGVSLSVPTLNDPANVTASGFHASWSEVPGASSYLVDIAEDDNFTELVDGYDKKEVTGTSIEVEELEPGMTYYYRVYSKFGGVISEPSAPKAVTLDDDDDDDGLTAPELNEATDVTDTGFIITWNEVDGAELYLLDISTDSDFNDLVESYNKKEIEGTSENVTGLISGQTYYVRVFAKQGESVSDASETQEVTLEE